MTARPLKLSPYPRNFGPTQFMVWRALKPHDYQSFEQIHSAIKHHCREDYLRIILRRFVTRGLVQALVLSDGYRRLPIPKHLRVYHDA